MDVAAHGQGNNIIARGCVGSLSDGSCNFDELMRHIQLTGRRIKPWTGSTDIGDDFLPDVRHAAQELANSGYTYFYDVGALFPTKFTSRQPQVTFGDVQKEITDRIQAARTTSGDEFFKTELQAVRDSITLVHEARLADLAVVKLRAINDELHKPGSPITWDVEIEKVIGQASEWDDIDTDATIKKHPNDAALFRQEIAIFERDWFKNNQQPRQHNAAIQECVEAERRIYGDHTC